MLLALLLHPRFAHPLEMALHQHPKGRGRWVAGISLLAFATPGQLQRGPVHVIHMMSTLASCPQHQFEHGAHHPAGSFVLHVPIPAAAPGQLLPHGAIWGVAVGGSADSPGLWLSRKPDTKSSPLPRPSQSQSLASASVYNSWTWPGCLVWDKAQSGRAPPCHHSGTRLPYLPQQTLSKSPGSWAALTGPRRRMPEDGCGRKTATPARFNHPGCAEELGGMGCGGKRWCWKQGDSRRLGAPWERVWGDLGRRTDAGLAGHSGRREVWISNPKQKISPLQPAEFGKGQQACSPALQDVLGGSQTFWG